MKKLLLIIIMLMMLTACSKASEQPVESDYAKQAYEYFDKVTKYWDDYYYIISYGSNIYKQDLVYITFYYHDYRYTVKYKMTVYTVKNSNKWEFLEQAAKYS